MDTLDIEKVANQVAEIATDLGYAELARNVDEEVSGFLRTSEYKIAMLGEFSVGKSSLINALIGDDVLPTRIEPTTTIVTELVHGEEAYLLRRGEMALGLTREEFQQRASGQVPCQPDDILEVTVMASMLKDHTRLVDTPGVHSLDDSHQDVTYGYLPQVDVAMVVLDSNQGDVPRTVISFLDDHLLRSDMGKLIFVLNKIDEIPESRRERIRDKFRQTLVEHIPDARVVLASAFMDEGELEEPGVDELNATLEHEILPARRALKANKAAKRLKSFTAQLLVSVETERGALQSSPEQVAQKIAELRRARDRIATDLRNVEEYVAERMETLRADAKGSIHRMLADVAQRAEIEVRGAGVNQAKTLDIQPKIKGWIAQGIERVATQQLHPALQDLANDVRGKIHSIQSHIPEFEVSANVKMRGEAVLDVIVEGALLVTLNVILPGEWLVAMMARIFGSRMVQSIKEPVLDALKQLIGSAVGQKMLDKVIKKLESTVMGLEPELSRQLVNQLAMVERKMMDELRERFDKMLDEHERALNEARSDRHKDDTERAARLEMLAKRAGLLEELLDNGPLAEVQMVRAPTPA